MRAAVLIARAGGILRDAAFMTPARALAYARILAALMLAGLAFDWISTAIGHHPWGRIEGPPGKPQATDFLAFWAAGRAYWAGTPGAAYDLAALSQREHANAVMDAGSLLAFFYPPSFLLLCLPFAALPYMMAFGAFVAGSLAVLATGLRRILDLPASARGRAWLWSYLPVLAFPGLLMNAATGQNGFCSAASFAWALIWLEARPGLAGACLGALVIKPHLALVAPVALLAARRWQALAACAATACFWMALSWLVLGNAAWRGFFAAAPAIRDALENHREDWSKLQSLFASLRLLGTGLGPAYGAQLALSAGVVIVLAVLAKRRPGQGPEVALMAAGAMLCSPHILDYDLAVTGVPLAWIAGQACRTGWLPWEKLGAGLVFLWPLVARKLTQSGDAPVAPILLLGLFLLTCRRIFVLRAPAPC
jgi:hypothetical protein